jgi:hypothetical protein
MTEYAFLVMTSIINISSFLKIIILWDIITWFVGYRLHMVETMWTGSNLGKNIVRINIVVRYTLSYNKIY